MELSEAYRRLRNNRFLRGKKVMVIFQRKTGGDLKVPATKFEFFVEEKLVRKLLREVSKR